MGSCGQQAGTFLLSPRVTAEPGTLTPHLPPSNMVIKNISPINYSNQQTFRILPLRDSVINFIIINYYTIIQIVHVNLYKRLITLDLGLDYSLSFNN